MKNSKDGVTGVVEQTSVAMESRDKRGLVFSRVEIPGTRWEGFGRF